MTARSAARLATALAVLFFAAPGRGAECDPGAPKPPISEAGRALEAANAQLLSGDRSGAIAAYAEVETAAIRAGDPRIAHFAAANSARARIGVDSPATIRARLEAVVVSEPPGPARTRLEIHAARSYLMLSRDTKAPADTQRGVALLRPASQSSDLRLRAHALGMLGEVYAEAGRPDDAQRLTRRALLAASEADAPEAQARAYAQLGQLARTRGDRGAALDAYRRAVAQLDVLRADLALGPVDAALAFRDEVEPVYDALVDLQLEESAARDHDAQQPLLAEARDTLEALKAAELRNHFRDACLDAQRKARPDDIPGTAVLYEWLIRPLEDELEGKTLQALVVVPGGALRTIPFAALRDARSGEYLIQKVPVAVSPGLTLTEPRPIRIGQGKGLIAGVSEAVLGFPALAAVSGEVEHVEMRVPGILLLDEDFSRARFEDAIANNPINVVHVASHGEFNGNAAESFLLAHDGKLAMDRFARSVGRTRLRADEPLELLVLSACQTAAGDERAALGLAGVALRAGARSALATLWSVNDEASAELIREFYDALAAGSSRGVALQTAQRTLIESPTYPHPAYWAPFLLLNSWL